MKNCVINVGKPNKAVLVITPCPKNGLPTQGLQIAERLRTLGFLVRILSRAQSSLARVLDVVVRGIIYIPIHEVVLVNLYGNRAFFYESFIILYAFLWKKRIVVLVHSGLFPVFVRKWPRWTKLVLRRPDVVLVPSEFLYQKLTEVGVRVDAVIPNYIDLEKYKFRERSRLEPRFLYVRGFWSVYNPEMALRAFSIVQKEYPHAVLTMAGREGDSSARCRMLVDELGLRNVHFIGLLQKGELIDIANHHDIHLHTNRSDNMPVSIIEMWACGLPIVGTKVGGMPYLVRNHGDAILVESGDFGEMAKACLRLLSDSELASQLSKNGRKRAEELTWDRVKESWRSVLVGNALRNGESDNFQEISKMQINNESKS